MRKASFLLLVVWTANNASASKSVVSIANAQIEWLRSKGGYFSPKLNIQAAFGSDENLGLFATGSFSKGETLMGIPRDCLLTSASGHMCDTTLNLIREFALRDESEYAPYIEYLFSKDNANIPSAWSDEGAELIEEIRGSTLLPDDLIEVSFEEDCDGSGRPLEEYAYWAVVSRAWSDIMVPLLDMINHHSGKYANVDTTQVHGNNDDVKVFATRDIEPGEQIFISLMDCTDQKGYEYEYVLPHLLRDAGFVDQYPQRWMFSARGDVVFDLNKSEDEQYELTWYSYKPNSYQIEYLEGELERLRVMEPHVVEELKKLEHTHERNVIFEYYHSLTIALEQAASPNAENVCWSEGNCSLDGDDKSQDHRNLASPAYWACNDYQAVHIAYQKIHDFRSHHQQIAVYYSEKEDDACLFLETYLHTCASSRPHYHEVFVHYPLAFVDEVKRILFIGGGDSMVLHEALKYPSLELVVGLELDQQVVRTSFQDFGTQPHWDDPRVEWWFGDAAKSLNLLPREYYGTFDLVIVDILTAVAQKLMVNDKLSVIDAAMLLLQPNGVIVKNEDEGYMPGTTTDYTDFSLDLLYYDVPLYCLQTFVLGSNGVDFLTAKPKDHKIDTIYLKGINEFQDQFDSWYNFGTSQSKRSALCNDELTTTPEPTAQKISLGALMVLEAENTTLPLDSSRLQEAMSTRVSQVGLNKTETILIPGVDDSHYTLILMMKEGYVAVQVFPIQKYCSFDIMLWKRIDLLTEIKKALTDVVGSSTPSVYRFITGGMLFQGEEDNIELGPPALEELCKLQTVGVNNDEASTEQVRKEKKADNFDPRKSATLSSYNNTLAREQWLTQKPLALQCIMQFEIGQVFIGETVDVFDGLVWYPAEILAHRPGGGFDVRFEESKWLEKNVEASRVRKQTSLLDKDKIRELLIDGMTRTLTLVEDSSSSTQKDIRIFDTFGDGVGMVAFWAGGYVVVSWDGRSHLDFNVRTDSNMCNQFESILRRSISNLLLKSREIHPRGIGRNVNFALKDEEIPVWTKNIV